ncbi:MucBP domain-containing protein [uncultured Abiotrophia sp.]|uniref:MucBP domain-containing protein n=1 Tax=uncultured Abiotrophia sp. TaxID=316094 RepID=UPI0028D7E4F0|nr:MucBP domain-containing protein [uncultured Abiotrophia sp.]
MRHKTQRALALSAIFCLAFPTQILQVFSQGEQTTVNYHFVNQADLTPEQLQQVVKENPTGTATTDVADYQLVYEQDASSKPQPPSQSDESSASSEESSESESSSSSESESSSSSESESSSSSDSESSESSSSSESDSESSSSSSSESSSVPGDPEPSKPQDPGSLPKTGELNVVILQWLISALLLILGTLLAWSFRKQNGSWKFWLLLVIGLSGLGAGRAALAQMNYLRASETQTVTKGQTYQYTPPKIDGFTYVGYIHTSSNKPKVEGTVTARYLTEKQDKLADDLVTTGTVGSNFTLEEKTFQGYELARIEGKVSGQYQTEPQVTTFIYTPKELQSSTKESGRVQVTYVDEKDAQLADPVTLEGEVDASYATEKKEITGYNFLRVEGPETGTFKTEVQNVKYIYQAIPKPRGTVNVTYVDKQDAKLSDPVTLEGEVDASYTTEKKEITGYNFLRVEGPETGTFKTEVQNVKYIYQAIPKPRGTVNVTYVDEQDAKLADPVTLEGEVDATYVAEKKEITGYNFLRVEGPETGTFKSEVQNVKYIYQAIPKPRGTVNVTYVDEQDAKLADPETLEGEVDAAYTVQKKEVSGYNFLRVEGPETGTFKTEVQNVKYIYQAIPKPRGTVNVSYVDEQDAKLADPVTLEGEVDAAYATEKKEITGYNFLRVEGPETGAFKSEVQSVKYIYQAIPKPRGTVNVTYVDEQDAKLSDPVSLEGEVDTAYATEKKEITGYNFLRVEGPETGTFKAEVQNVKYIYQAIPKPRGTVNVTYVDEQDAKLADPETLEGEVDAAYTTQKKEVAGYNFLRVEGPETGTFKTEAQNVKYIYQAIPKPRGTVNVTYVDEQDAKLADPVTLEGEVDTAYTTEKKEITGYNFLRVEGPETGTFKAEVQNVKYIYQAIPKPRGTVNVTYVDEQDAKLADPVTLEGEVDAAYATEKKEITGYNFLRVEGPETGTFKVEAQNVKYIYQAIPKPRGTVNVTYVDEQDAKLADPVTLEGEVDASYTTEKKEITGYNFLRVEGPETGTFKSEVQNVKYIYQAIPKPRGTVNVTYVDEQDAKLADPVTLEGEVDATYVAEKKEITGYNFLRVEGPATGTFKTEVQNVKYIYQAIPKPRGTVNVTYVDEQDAKLADPVTLEGEVDASYTTEKKEITSYNFLRVEGPATGSFKSEVQNVKYIYQAIPKPRGTVNVTYVDEQNAKLADPETLEGEVDAAYTAQKKEVSGYNFLRVEGPETGTFKAEVQNVKYIYQAIPKPRGTVNVTYVDEQDAKLADPVTLEGEVDASYTTEKKEITGYNFLRVEGSETGTFKTEVQNVKYIYQAIPKPRGTVNVTYVDEQNAKLADPETLEGEVDAAYTAQKKEVSGYNFLRVEGPATGTFKSEVQNVKYIYQAIPKPRGTVNVTYVDEQDAKLADPETLEGEVDAAYTTQKKEVAGYNFLRVEGPETGTFKTEVQNVKYIYQAIPKPRGTVNVLYVDEADQPVADAETLEGEVDTAYTATQKEVREYNFLRIEGDRQGTFATEAKIVKFVYQPANLPPNNGAVNVRYVDETNDDLLPPVDMAGLLGDNYQTEEKAVEGYRLSYVSGETQGTYASQKHYVTYVYASPRTKARGKVVVRYKTVKGETLHPDVVTTGYVGTDAPIEVKKFENYFYQGREEYPPRVTYQEGTQVVILLYSTKEYKKEESGWGDAYARYVDENGKEINPSVYTHGRPGASYEFDTLDIENYILIRTEGEKKGKYISGQTRRVDFVYRRIAKVVTSKVIVYYRNEADVDLGPAEEIKGAVGDYYTTTQKHFVNHRFTRVEGETEGQITEEPQKVTYYYERLRGDLTVKYEDEAGEELAQTKYLTDYVGLPYQEKARSFDNYELVRVDGPEMGFYTEEAQTITYVYRKSIGYVKVNYQDTDGHSLWPTINLSGQIDTAYSTEKKEIEGYVFDHVDGSETGNYSLETQTVTYVYRKGTDQELPGIVRVRYQDDQGTLIIPEIVMKGELGKNYYTRKKEFRNYIFRKVEGEEFGQYSEQEQVVTYIYEGLRDSRINEGILVVRYVDEANEDLAPPIRSYKPFGTPYQTEQKQFDNFTFLTVLGNTTGTYQLEEQVVTYVYRSVYPDPGKVIVDYVDNRGNYLAERVILRGTVGTQYVTEKKNIENYQYVGVQGEVTGKYAGYEKHVIYYYQPIAPGLELYGIVGNNIPEDPRQTERQFTIGGTVGLPISTLIPRNPYPDLYDFLGHGVSYDNLRSQPNVFEIRNSRNERGEVWVYYRRRILPGIIRVNFLDEAGEKLEVSEIHDGLVGETYDLSSKHYISKDDKKYELASDESEFKGQFEDSPKVVNLRYKRTTATVTLKYVDESGQDLDQYVAEYQKHIEVPKGVETTIRPADLSQQQYTLKRTGQSLFAAFNEDTTITLTYHHFDKFHTATARYVDEEGHEIGSETVKGHAETPYYLVPEPVPGYVYSHTQGQPSGFLEAEETIVTFVYNSNPKHRVIQRHFNNETKELMLSIEKVALEGKKFTFRYEKAVRVEGDYFEHEDYRNVERDYNYEDYTFSSEDPETVYMDYYYNPIHRVTKTVKHVTVSGEELAQTRTDRVEVGTEYEKATQGDFPDYELTSVPENAQGTAPDHDFEIVFVYRRVTKLYIEYYNDDSIYGGPVRVHLKESTVNQGEPYTVTPEENLWDWLVYDYSDDPLSGTVGDKPIVVKLHYRVPSYEEKTVITLRHVTEDGQEIHEPTTLSAWPNRYVIPKPVAVANYKYSYLRKNGETLDGINVYEEAETYELVYTREETVVPVMPAEAANQASSVSSAQGPESTASRKDETHD